MIGDTICTREFPKALKRIAVDEPTVSMKFTINTSPLAGREGTLVQSSKIRDRLIKETLKNVSIRVEESERTRLFPGQRPAASFRWPSSLRLCVARDSNSA